MVNSKKPITLSPEDTRIVVNVLEKRSRASNFQQTLNRLISRWNDFSAEVARGYKDTIYDYENELGTRDILDDIMHRLSTSGFEEIMRHVDNADKIFLSSTKPIPPRYENHDSGMWWWQRIPSLLGDELKQDFIDAGYKV